MRLAVITALLALVATPLAAAPAAEPALAVGQAWTVKGSALPSVRVIVGAIDRMPDGRVAVSASIVGARFDGGPSSEDFFPFEESLFRRGVDRLVATHVAAPPGFEPAYRRWRSERGRPFGFPVFAVVGRLEHGSPSGPLPPRTLRCTRGPLYCP